MLQQNLIISLPTYPKFCWYATGTTHIFHLGLIVSPLPLVGAHTKICPKYWKSTSVVANNDLLTKNSSKTHMLTQWHHSFMNDYSDCSIVGKMHEEKPVSPLADGQLTITVSHMIYEPRHEISNNLTFWQVKTWTSLCSLLLSLESPNDASSVA